MAFFGVPLSGLIASQDQLTSVSNNLANLDTVGFKDQTVSFSDLFAQSSLTNGANNPIESGLGVTAAQTDSDFTDGGISATGIDSNMALSGNGFFVTQANTGVQSYTRAGDFTVNPAGYLTTASGDLVLGYGATNGVVSTTGTLQSLQVGLGSVIPASATSQFEVKANLNANAATGSTFSSTTPVFDSLGAQHLLTVTYTKSPTTNTWGYTASMPTADLAPGSGPSMVAGPSSAAFAFGSSAAYTGDALSGSATIQAGSGAPVTISAAGLTGAQFLASLQGNATLQADGITATLTGSTITLSGPANLAITNNVADTTSAANLAYTAPTVSASTVLATGSLNFDSSGNMIFAPVVPATTPATYTKSLSIAIPGFADGGASTTLAWNLADSNGNGTITQTDLANTTASTQNGQGAGTLTSFSVQADGTIQGVYSNGQTDALGQVAIASFANTQGLTRTGGNDYRATPGSGTASIGTAETGGRGTITGGSVEASNVDVAAEFAKMIVAQQAYQANAKTVTTFQQISQATIQMISA